MADKPAPIVITARAGLKIGDDFRAACLGIVREGKDVAPRPAAKAFIAKSRDQPVVTALPEQRVVIETARKGIGIITAEKAVVSGVAVNFICTRITEQAVMPRPGRAEGVYSSRTPPG